MQQKSSEGKDCVLGLWFPECILNTAYSVLWIKGKWKFDKFLDLVSLWVGRERNRLKEQGRKEVWSAVIKAVAQELPKQMSTMRAAQKALFTWLIY